MLWKFHKKDSEVCHFMLGTMHLATDEAYTYVNVAEKYIDKVAVYAGEMDLNLSVNQNMLPHLTLKDDGKFSSFFRPKQYEKYRKAILKSYKFDILAYDRFTPFFLNNLLAESSISTSKNESLDHYLWTYATDSEKEMCGIESFDDQLNVLRNIPLDYQIKSFRTTVKNISSFKEKLHKLNQLYLKGDIKEIYRISKKSMGKIRNLMIYDRNLKMVERIVHLTSEKSTFVAIGAAHMAGKKGLISLLKEKGYSVSLLKN